MKLLYFAIFVVLTLCYIDLVDSFNKINKMIKSSFNMPAIEQIKTHK